MVIVVVRREKSGSSDGVDGDHRSIATNGGRFERRGSVECGTSKLCRERSKKG
jgi:hypothetical protein